MSSSQKENRLVWGNSQVNGSFHAKPETIHHCQLQRSKPAPACHQTSLKQIDESLINAEGSALFLFFCERKVPANADSSVASSSTACVPLCSLLAGWIVSQFFPCAAVDGAALRLKKMLSSCSDNSGGEQWKGSAGTDGLLAFCQEVASTFSVNTAVVAHCKPACEWDAAVPPLPTRPSTQINHAYVYTTHTCIWMLSSGSRRQRNRADQRAKTGGMKTKRNTAKVLKTKQCDYYNGLKWQKSEH